jgi:hypothetical protein
LAKQGETPDGMGSCCHPWPRKPQGGIAHFLSLGGLDKHKLLLDAILQWVPPTSPKLDILKPSNATACAI